jgi:sigma54-dependent transcription regulator
VHIPPLRDRKSDIRLLIEYFIDRYSSKTGKKMRRIAKKSLDHLQTYPWPGNIRLGNFADPNHPDPNPASVRNPGHGTRAVAYWSS